jgi:hypothetical protein
MDLDEADLASGLLLALGASGETPEESSETAAVVDAYSSVEANTSSTTELLASVPSETAPERSEEACATETPTQEEPKRQPVQGLDKKPADGDSQMAASAKQLPPVPVFEAPPGTTAADAQMQEESGGASSSGSSSSSEDLGEDDEDGEEEDDSGAEDMEVDDEADAPDAPGDSEAKPRARLFKLGEFCCEVLLTLVRGKKEHAQLLGSFNIDLRAKVERCRAHLDQAGDQVTVWHCALAQKKGRIKYQALCDYFIGKERVGLVDAPSYYVYFVPPGGKFFPELGMAEVETLVGFQVPKDMAEG